MPEFHRSRSAVTSLSPEKEETSMTLLADTRLMLLRPPSVVVSDHDRCQLGETTYLTLEDLDNDFNQYHHRRRLSDSSTCSSLSFSELDFHMGGPEEDSEGAEESGGGCSNKVINYFILLAQEFIDPLIED
jgi:hypothetical protein